MFSMIVAVTGASGSIYGWRLLEELLQRELPVSLVVSTAARQVMEQEFSLAEWSWSKSLEQHRYCHVYTEDDIAAPMASGSRSPEAMVIAPCSMATLAAVSQGLAQGLIARAADVMLKERRQLIIVPRETPLSIIHLQNLLRLSQAGATILPAMPAFYHHPQTLADQVDFIIGKILDQLDISHDLFQRYRA